MPIWMNIIVFATSALSITLLILLAVYMRLMYQMQRNYREMHARTMLALEEVQGALTELMLGDDLTRTQKGAASLLGRDPRE